MWSPWDVLAAVDGSLYQVLGLPFTARCGCGSEFRVGLWRGCTDLRAAAAQILAGHVLQYGSLQSLQLRLCQVWKGLRVPDRLILS